MPRIAGINIPDNKQIRIALTYIYGIGNSLSLDILRAAEIDPKKKAKDLTSEELSLLKNEIGKQAKIEGDLRREVSMNIKRLKDIKSWKGIRHLKGLPVRGQNTRINSRTVRGNVRKTIGSGRVKAPTPK